MVKKIILPALFIFLSLSSPAQSIREYIEGHIDIAKKLMREHGIPASITLGVAIHESAAGNSKVARYLNNHFGVKGKNNSTQIRSAYRGYDSVEDSYEDFANFMTTRPAYSQLFEQYSPYDYTSWARGIARGGYAASTSWATQVINLIKKYELYQYDDRPESYVETLLPGADAIQPVKALITPAKKSGVYTVKKGDNLNKIARMAGTTAVKLMKLNNLRTATLQPGQKIKLK